MTIQTLQTTSTNFVLEVIQVDDDPSFTDLVVDESGGNTISLIEDTPPVSYDSNGDPIPFAREVKIFYTDDDWCNGATSEDCEDPENAADDFLANEITLSLDPYTAEPQIVFNPLSRSCRSS